MKPRPGRSPHQGVALVLVLWLLALFTIMAAGYSTTMRTESRLTAHETGSARARALSQGGIWHGVHELLRRQSEQGWQRNGVPYSVPFGKGEMEIRIYDETGKIDLNTARPELLLGLVRSAGVSEAASEQIVHAIEDWRDKDNLVRSSGAEDMEYTNAGFQYGAKNGPFNTVGELRQIMGMTEQVFKQIAPALTVYSHRATVNPGSAPTEVLLALPDSNRADIEAYLETRTSVPGDNQVITPSPGSRFLSRAGGNTFTVTSTGKSGNTRYTTEAVVLLKQNAQMPFSVLSWKEGVSGVQ